MNREYEERLTALLPADQTSEAIRQSIAAIKLEIASTETKLIDLLAQYEELVLSRDTEKRLAITQEVEAAQTFNMRLHNSLERLDVFLKDKEKEELIKQLKAERAKLNYTALAEDFAAAYARDYLPHAIAIAEIMEKERLALAVFQKTIWFCKRLRDLNVEIDWPARPSTYAVGGQIATSKNLSDLVRLPGVRGAPFVPIDHSLERKIRYVEQDVFDEPFYIQDQKKIGMRIVEVPEDVHVRTPRWEDAPIWPPEPLTWRKDGPK